jgi:glutamate-1-semialdehyde 2,1-aminomutase
VYQAGTVSGNPVAVAAGIATLAQTESAGFYDSLAAERARSSMAVATRRPQAVEFCAQSVGGMFGLYFAGTIPGFVRDGDDLRQGAVQALLPRHARRGRVPRAVRIRSRGFVSAAHSADDIAQTVRRSGTGRSRGCRCPSCPTSSCTAKRSMRASSAGSFATSR